MVICWLLIFRSIWFWAFARFVGRSFFVFTSFLVSLFSLFFFLGPCSFRFRVMCLFYSLFSLCLFFSSFLSFLLVIYLVFRCRSLSFFCFLFRHLSSLLVVSFVVRSFCSLRFSSSYSRVFVVGFSWVFSSSFVFLSPPHLFKAAWSISIRLSFCAPLGACCWVLFGTGVCRSAPFGACGWALCRAGFGLYSPFGVWGCALSPSILLGEYLNF